jgi:hypothetical protein
MRAGHLLTATAGTAALVALATLLGNDPPMSATPAPDQLRPMDSALGSNAQTTNEPPTGGGAGVRAEMGASRPAFPEDAEARIWQVLSGNPQWGFTSINRVSCRAAICELRYTGGPDFSESSANSDALIVALNDALPMLKSATTSSRVEVSPGAYASVVTIRTYLGSEVLKK